MNAGRLQYVYTADHLLDDARVIARRFTHRDKGTFVSGLASEVYFDRLKRAATYYRQAGLGLLAGRVEWLSKGEHIGVAWEKFDRLNAGGCGVA